MPALLTATIVAGTYVGALALCSAASRGDRMTAEALRHPSTRRPRVRLVANPFDWATDPSTEWLR